MGSWATLSCMFCLMGPKAKLYYTRIQRGQIKVPHYGSVQLSGKCSLKRAWKNSTQKNPIFVICKLNYVNICLNWKGSNAPQTRKWYIYLKSTLRKSIETNKTSRGFCLKKKSLKKCKSITETSKWSFIISIRQFCWN